MATYVISDLHGRKNKYDEVIAYLKPTDHLYILGDVIDRFDDGIAILLDIMQRDNVTLLMGNHEKMMIDYLQADEDCVGTYEDYQFFSEIWERNGAMPTQSAYYRLDMEERRKVRDFLEHLPYAICDLKVNGRVFYLCHAYPLENYQEGIIYGSSLSEDEKKEFVWKRFVYGEKPTEKKIHIVGHTPTPYYHMSKDVKVYMDINEEETSGLIDIDCNLASKNDHVRLGMLCLDDLKVCYF